MSRATVALIVLLMATMLSGCIVRHRRHHHGPPPPARHCRTECAHWAEERRCERRCRVRANGVCVGWERRCFPRRYCRRHREVCH